MDVILIIKNYFHSKNKLKHNNNYHNEFMKKIILNLFF